MFTYFLQEKYMSDYNLVDQVIIVTGAAGNIGSVISRECASAGATIVLVDLAEASFKAVEAELGDCPSLVVPTDITNPESVQNMVATTVDTFGRADVIINNAGGGAAMKEPEDTPYEEWQRLVDLNLTAAFNCCIATGKQMIKQKSGKIINISSTAGTKGNPGMIHYSAAKAGVISLTNNLAFSWAKHNICVNAVVPGLIATPQMIEWGVIPPAQTEDGEDVPRLTRPPGPQDVAQMCRFLASPAADMITGEAIPVRAWFPSDRFWK
jgi:NAD(P)-dependent dehydrogenase (short-subunit alcohol dehydrogenase family)